MSKEVFDYFRQVLGVQEVLNYNLDSSYTVTKKELAMPQARIFVFIENLNHYSDLEKDLLDKMIMATKIKSEEFYFVDLSEKNQIANQYNLQNKITFDFVNKSELATNQTYSPELLLKKPDLKKDTWLFLQEIMKRFSQLPRLQS